MWKIHAYTTIPMFNKISHVPDYVVCSKNMKAYTKIGRNIKVLICKIFYDEVEVKEVKKY